jgi:hypothetical protein
MPDRDILDQIDDVITWDGRSPDAMAWTDKPPMFPVIDEEGLRQVGEQMTRQVQAFVDALRPAVEQVMRNVGEAVKAFAALAPHLRQVEETGRLERRAMKQAYRRRRARSRRR